MPAVLPATLLRIKLVQELSKRKGAICRTSTFSDLSKCQRYAVLVLFERPSSMGEVQGNSKLWQLVVEVQANSRL